MPPERQPTSTPPPSQQAALFHHVKRCITTSKYIDFLKVIKEYQTKVNTSEEKKTKILYLKFVSTLFSRYKKEERALLENGRDIKEGLEKTNLTSAFLSNHLRTHVDNAHAGGSYYDSTVLDAGEKPPTYSGMTKGDSEVLNRDYILSTQIRSWDKRRIAQGKENLSNDKNDQDLQVIENRLHHEVVRVSRFMNLQSRIQYIVQQAQSGRKPGSSKTNREASLEFPDVEVAALADMFRKDKRGEEKECKLKAREILKSLLKAPLEKGNELLQQLGFHFDKLLQAEKQARLEYRKGIQQGYYNSVMRNTETIKFLQYPSLNFDSLLNEILDLVDWKDPNPTSFMGRDDDVGRNIGCEEAFFMQFEATRWHSEALGLIFKNRNSAQLQSKIEQFQRVVMSFFDLVHSEQSSSRAHRGDFTGVVLFGDELLYAAIRLYHALLTRLNTALLLADAAVADTAFRNNLNEVGIRKRRKDHRDVYLSDSAAEAGGWKPKLLPTVEGTAEDKMNAFLTSLTRRISGNRKDDYAPQNFERDVTAAVGPKGNQLFTVPRILHRLRDTFREMHFEQLDIFERYLNEMKDGNRNATKNYQSEVAAKEEDWLFKFQCEYADCFELESVGKKGDIGRVTVEIVKRGVAPEKKNSKRPTNAGPGAKGRKKRKKAFT